MKRIVIAILLVTILMGVVYADNCKMYPQVGVVMAIDEFNHVVYVQLFNDICYPDGAVYGFLSLDDYVIGDIVGMIMDDNGTPDSIFDDIIIDARYCGYAW